MNTPIEKATPKWKVHTPKLLREIMNNSGTAILLKPINIFQSLLASVAERASEINDSKLNSLMARLTFYEACDPHSKEYDVETVRNLEAGKCGVDVVQAVNQYAALKAVAEAAGKHSFNCNCSPKERLSGHRSGCFIPELEVALAALQSADKEGKS